MRMTTDANDKITLAEVIAGHGRDLRQRLDEAGKKPGTLGVREADALLERLMKLSKQAGAVGFNLDGSRISQTPLQELRSIIAKHKGGAE